MSRRVVLEASAALDAVLLGAGARGVLEVLDGAALVIAPELFSFDVSAGLCEYVRAGEVAAEEAVALHETAMDLVDALVPDHEVATEALVEAIRLERPAWSLHYAVLARRHGCSVCTLDAGLARTLDGMGIAALHVTG